MNRESILYRYSQFSVDRNIDKSRVIDQFVEELKECKVHSFEWQNDKIDFYYKIDDWESNYFSVNSVKILFIDFIVFKKEALDRAIDSFKELISQLHNNKYIITIEIPAEDIMIMQALNINGFRTIETRLHYLNNNLEEFSYPRCGVREANKSDIGNLKQVASFMRNSFDRFHADWSFNQTKADEYLETYIENSINGFTDVILVPNEKDLPSDSFLTANFYNGLWEKFNYPISKMVLSAVSSSSNKGWYIKLISEMTYFLKAKGAKSIFLNTQATNIAVLVTWEKLGYKIGRATHLLTFNPK